MTHFRLPPIQIILSESGIPESVQVIRTGTFYDPRYGKVEITKDVLKKFAENFAAGVRRIDLAVDYFHESASIAAGWFRKVFLNEDGTQLWAEIEWTPKGKQVLADKEVRYISADFDFDYQDNESKKKFGPTLFGAGLTNRPVIKGMTPTTTLTEYKGDHMTLEEIQEQLKALSEKFTASEAKNVTLEAQLVATTKKLDEMVAAAPVEKKDDDAAEEKVFEEMDEMDEKAFDALDEAGKKAAYMGLRAKHMASKKVAALAEKKAEFDRMLTSGKVVEAQRVAFMENNMKVFAEKSASVKLATKGTGETPAEGSTSAQDEVIKLAEGKLEKKEASSLTEAIGLVLHENPELSARRKAEIAANE